MGALATQDLTASFRTRKTISPRKYNLDLYGYCDMLLCKSRLSHVRYTAIQQMMNINAMW